ncbi:MAG: hypothetical protein L0H79_10195 [Intrasporangium sp.]|uniref:hypothetical protein n=1 Tax=Intrasporangium sp. TaxID=1925024 RepID=UPI0026489D9A|nr:hypothetical protein [Intrasporangium sp.]MDN5796106.1 hypothetical protein [Intrasporangium sp.]
MAHAGESIREWLTHPSTIVAVALLVLGLLVVGLEVQSPNWVYYAGEQVTGTVEGGIVYYTVGGEDYTKDDTRATQSPDGTKVTVYYWADHPETAQLDGPVRWIEGVVMLIWFVAAGLLLVVSAARRSRRARHRPPQTQHGYW